MLTVDDDEVNLVLMAIRRVEAEATEQVRGRLCSGVAWYCTELCLTKLKALRGRIEEHQQDEKEERNDAGPSE